ncbi:MAG: hypothetical protein AAGF45_05400 [Pseudomonadota bacterium]
MGVFGVTVLPEWAQAEGIDPVLDRLQTAGVTDIATSPYVMEPDPDGSREPPADGGLGLVRLLDRPLWGERALNVRTAPSYAPDVSLYEGCPDQPPVPEALTAREGETVGRFIDAAKGRGMRVYLQVQAAIPPGYRVQFSAVRPQDEGLGPDDAPVRGRVDGNASLASGAVLAYTSALLKDLAKAYPAVDGVRIDWPEYPPYNFRSLFLDFAPAALVHAEVMGIDAARMRRDTLAVREALKTPRQPSGAITIELLENYPGAADLLRLRRHLTVRFVRKLREALPAHMALVPQTFPPPLHLLSGFDIAAIAPAVEGVGIKFYTMHWPMILGEWARALGGADWVAGALHDAFAPGGPRPETADDFVYPAPDEPHTAGSAAIAAKMTAAREEAGRDADKLFAFTHAYGPLGDVVRRAEACWMASEGRMWVNRYGYLSDEKIAALGALVRG